MPHKELLDPQGKTVEKNMKNIELESISNVRIGKHVELLIDASSEEEAVKLIEIACNKMLVNAIMETYTYQLSQIV